VHICTFAALLVSSYNDQCIIIPFTAGVYRIMLSVVSSGLVEVLSS